ncbi:MAG: hypothetical protein LBG14_00880 [Treponema sp.]|jgi:hypothetical protein|nr:hypothetical protein [Treponema sp.]
MKTLFFVIPLICIFSCASNGPESQPEASAPDIPPPAFADPVFEDPAFEVQAAALQEAEEYETGFDPQSVTVEEKETTMDEMRLLIAEINRVIRARDYEVWFSYLADDFIAAISSPDYLARLSESSQQLKGQNIVLKTPQDYFTYVVVASRENIRVDASLDDIEFLSHNRVKAYTVNARKQRLRLFEFVKAEGAWKIAFSS